MVLGLAGTAAWVAAHAPGEKMAAPWARYSWTAPVEGSPVDHYRAEILVNGLDTLVFGGLPHEEVNIPVSFGNKYQVRVVAVDAAGLESAPSIWSEPYSPELDPPSFLP